MYNCLLIVLNGPIIYCLSFFLLFLFGFPHNSNNKRKWFCNIVHIYINNNSTNTYTCHTFGLCQYWPSKKKERRNKWFELTWASPSEWMNESNEWNWWMNEWMNGRDEYTNINIQMRNIPFYNNFFLFWLLLLYDFSFIYISFGIWIFPIVV